MIYYHHRITKFTKHLIRKKNGGGEKFASSIEEHERGCGGAESEGKYKVSQIYLVVHESRFLCRET